ncbi:MAG: 30S ribosomal protein S8 [Desulfurellaceae bacterium]|jgi:small subunit ribosomal protein S8|nr:30S ribosomal protein S8 [Desulfurellaceae bacterium]
MDRISDGLARIKNALARQMESVDLLSNRVVLSVCEVLKKEGFISDFKVLEDKRNMARIYLKYIGKDKPTISLLRRISKSSRRVYVRYSEIPYVMNGLGVSILSTSKGIISNKTAKKLQVGGELICEVF